MLEQLVFKGTGGAGFLDGASVKNPPANTGDIRIKVLIPTSPEGGHGNPLQYSHLENPMDGGVWWATVYGVAKSWTRLKRLGMHTQDACGQVPSLKVTTTLTHPKPLQ